MATSMPRSSSMPPWDLLSEDHENALEQDEEQQPEAERDQAHTPGTRLERELVGGEAARDSSGEDSPADEVLVQE